jgi:hypothetical protein
VKNELYFDVINYYYQLGAFAHSGTIQATHNRDGGEKALDKESRRVIRQ